MVLTIQESSFVRQKKGAQLHVERRGYTGEGYQRRNVLFVTADVYSKFG